MMRKGKSAFFSRTIQSPVNDTGRKSLRMIPQRITQSCKSFSFQTTEKIIEKSEVKQSCFTDANSKHTAHVIKNGIDLECKIFINSSFDSSTVGTIVFDSGNIMPYSFFVKNQKSRNLREFGVDNEEITEIRLKFNNEDITLSASPSMGVPK